MNNTDNLENIYQKCWDCWDDEYFYLSINDLNEERFKGVSYGLVAYHTDEKAYKYSEDNFFEPINEALEIYKLYEYNIDLNTIREIKDSYLEYDFMYVHNDGSAYFYNFDRYQNFNKLIIHEILKEKRKKYLLLILRISVKLLYLHTLAVITSNHPTKKLLRGEFNYIDN